MENQKSADQIFFAENRFWLKNEYPDVEGNYRVCPDMIIRKGHIDPLILELQLNPPLKSGERRKIGIRISTEESRKQLEKDFSIKASV